MVRITYRFAGKRVSFESKDSRETDFFLKTLREFNIEIVSVQRILVLN